MDKRMCSFGKGPGGHRCVSGSLPRGSSAIQCLGCFAAAVILFTTGCASVGPANDGKTKNMSAITSFPTGIKLRLGHAVVDGPAWRAELPALIEESNREARLEGLPDHLNQEIIDRTKTV